MKKYVHLKNTFLIFSFLLGAFVQAKQPDQKTLPRIPTRDEIQAWKEGKIKKPSHSFSKRRTPPLGTVHALAEWEDSAGVMVSWSNVSLVSELAKRGKVVLLADTKQDQKWWENWLTEKKIPNRQNIRFFIAPTETMYVRDYGPWFILHDKGKMAMVDPKYYQNRPYDDQFPAALASALKLENYALDVKVEGGNFHTDGTFSGFSEKWLFHQNKELPESKIRDLFKSFVGTWLFGVFELGPSDWWDHIDTYGNLVSPDTWVVGEFPPGSAYRTNSEEMVKQLSQMMGPYGKPYKIFRMPMVPIGNSNPNEYYYRGYVNAFISNRSIYMPTYGGQADQLAKQVYEKALPGYEVVGVDGSLTAWMDATHCRTRNIPQRDTLFVFPQVFSEPMPDQPIEMFAYIYPTPGASLKGLPKVYWKTSTQRGNWNVTEMERVGSEAYAGNIPPQPAGTKISLFVEAMDTKNRIKRGPIAAPAQLIEIELKTKSSFVKKQYRSKLKIF